MKKFLKRYAFPIIMILALIGLVIFDTDRGITAAVSTFGTVKEMLLLIPPIFVLLGLLDVWVPRETMIRFLGEGSGFKGALISIIIGSAAAGPLYVAFPIAAMLMKKGAKFSNVVLFLGAWSTTKVPMVTFEVTSLGPLFGFTRLALSMVGIIVIALILNAVMKKNEVEQIYHNAENL